MSEYTVHAEFYHRDEHADVSLVSSFGYQNIGHAGRGMRVEKWAIRWVYQAQKDNDYERFPSEKEAKQRYIELLAQTGASP